MSLDVFLTRWSGGAEVPLDPAAVRAVVEPLAAERDPEHLFVRVETRDGSVDVYGYGDPCDSLMLDLDGEDDVRRFALDLARAAGAVLALADAPVAVPDEALLADLPDGLRDGAVVVRSVDDLTEFLRS
ncbi:hypothetical protein ACFEMC_04205 [Kineococcus sp. DHX-1]|uniref:hypothetical protein n=1 Tax=Kineococcus sp. DHX-1 TaxID=3349638 RepID=UPI0036D34FC5